MEFEYQTYLPDIDRPLQFVKCYTEILKAKETYKTNINSKLSKAGSGLRWIMIR
jgi:hypothetical protein